MSAAEWLLDTNILFAATIAPECVPSERLAQYSDLVPRTALR